MVRVTRAPTIRNKPGADRDACRIVRTSKRRDRYARAESPRDGHRADDERADPNFRRADVTLLRAPNRARPETRRRSRAATDATRAATRAARDVARDADRDVDRPIARARRAPRRDDRRGDADANDARDAKFAVTRANAENEDDCESNRRRASTRRGDGRAGTRRDGNAATARAPTRVRATRDARAATRARDENHDERAIFQTAGDF